MHIVSMISSFCSNISFEYDNIYHFVILFKRTILIIINQKIVSTCGATESSLRLNHP